MKLEDTSMVKLRRTSKLAGVVYFNVFSPHSPVEIDRERETPFRVQLRFETSTYSCIIP
jgi:hypothetical protein